MKKSRMFLRIVFIKLFFKLGFTPCKAEQPIRDMELQEKEVQKDYIAYRKSI